MICHETIAQRPGFDDFRTAARHAVTSKPRQ
jgi:hypothetical protein